MFTDNKNQETTGSQLVDNTGSDASQTLGNSMTGEIYTMPKPDGSGPIKPSKGKSSPKLMIIIAAIVVIAVIAAGFWFYSTMTVIPEDNLLINPPLNNDLLPLDEVDEEEEEVSSTPVDRDRQRLDDITGVRSALALYYQEMKAYPDIMDDLLDNYLDNIPINPSPGGNSYIYVPQNSNQSYKLTFTLEEGGVLGILTLKSGEYQAGPSLIEPFIENGEEEAAPDTGDDLAIELISGLDTDEDGLTDIEENLYATNSALVDTDEDGYSDASELVNLYDPAQVATLLADTETVTQYINTEYNYSILYPTEWTVRALTEEKEQVIFNSETTEFVQILVLENPLGLSARNWYLSYNEDIEADSLEEIVLNNIVGVQAGAGRYTYLGVGSSIYSIIYNVGTTNQLNYQATYDMMLNSWELITIDEGLPSENRDAQRLKDITDIRFALLEYQVENLTLPEIIDDDVDSYQMIGNNAGDCAMSCDNVSTITQCADLTSILVPDYLVSIPSDPLDGTIESTGYYLNVLTDGTLIAGACQAEVEETIEVNN
ncbi:hypothetical protein ISR92_00910 [Patescibacteria group bacterium]|nr:hypothetical protein [Patescibacteria group bacterium]